ncbi:MAG: hypothetical protein Q3986_03615 [Akkermansia sp.]|nr:hypothetical protein [Akkermansia sp.]
MKYVNLENSGDNKTSVSWLNYYMSHVAIAQRLVLEMSEPLCPVCGLHEIEVGAHVGKLDVNDRHAYLLPLCSSCNQKTDVMSLRYDVDLVKVPIDSEGFSEISYPQFAVDKIKKMAHGRLNAWDGKPQQ